MPTVTIRYQVPGADPDHLHEVCGLIMDELVQAADSGDVMVDPTVGGTMARGEVEITMTYPESITMDAANSAVGLLRATITRIESTRIGPDGWYSGWTALTDAAVVAVHAVATAELPTGG